MLSEAEQRKLTSIESQLRLDDPAFVERFTGGSKRRAGRGHGTAASVALIVALIAVGTGLVLASVPTVVIALTTIGAIAGLWITKRGGP
jgi:hypothetical protein